MARPRVHDRDTGEVVLDRALGILRAAGPEAISVRAVADAAGTSTRAVYAVFGSKQALVDALAERGYRRLAELVAAVRETDDPVADLVARPAVADIGSGSTGRSMVFVERWKAWELRRLVCLLSRRLLASRSSVPMPNGSRAC